MPYEYAGVHCSVCDVEPALCFSDTEPICRICYQDLMRERYGEVYTYHSHGEWVRPIFGNSTMICSQDLEKTVSRHVSFHVKESGRVI